MTKILTNESTAAERAAWLAEQNAKQPAREALFNAVIAANGTGFDGELNWKSRIDCFMPAPLDIAATNDALIHFTGAGGKFRAIKRRNGTVLGYHVTAAGYYATIGA